MLPAFLLKVGYAEPLKDKKILIIMGNRFEIVLVDATAILVEHLKNNEMFSKYRLSWNKKLEKKVKKIDADKAG